MQNLDTQAAPADVTRALADVTAERQRQITIEHWTPEHDDLHVMGDLIKAAISYCWVAVSGTRDAPFYWPWSLSWWKPKDDRRNLVKAAALIIAEIERLDRAALALAEKGE